MLICTSILYFLDSTRVILYVSQVKIIRIYLIHGLCLAPQFIRRLKTTFLVPVLRTPALSASFSLIDGFSQTCKQQMCEAAVLTARVGFNNKNSPHI